jgi:glycosyltransferase involved in cell wall biosynthesis
MQFLPTGGRGGCEEYALTIAKGALLKGWDVRGAIPALNELDSLRHDYAKAGGRPYTLSVHPTYQRPPHHKIEVLPRVFRSAALLARIRPNVVQVVLPHPFFGLGPILAAALWRIPTQVVFQLVPPDCRALGKTGSLYRWAKQRNQQWVAVSDQNRRLIGKLFGIDSAEIDLIYNGADIPNGLETPGSRDVLITEFSLPSDATIVLSVGRLSNQKGFDLLLKAAPHLLRDFPTLRFLIAGEGADRQCLEETIRAYGLIDRVFLLGQRTDISRLLSASDLFLFPSRYEGQPFALVEAIAAGLPVVAAAASGIPEIVEHNVSGALFKPDDACDLLEVTRWALQNRHLWPNWATAGKEVVRKFSRSRMLEETITSLNKLAQN